MGGKVLSESEVLHALAAADGPDWHLLGGKLIKTVVCPSFTEALEYVLEVGRLAEEADHHPDIDIRYNRVTLGLVTHDSDGITALDLALARSIDAIGNERPD
jgi:4a-hydroxytetrahydrobiopterin dehydratase